MIDAALLKALGGGLGGGAAALLVAYTMLFPTKDRYEDHVTEFRNYTAAEQASDLRQQILDTVERAAAQEPGEYKTALCKNLDQAIGQLCQVAPMDALCEDRDVYRRRAGCS